MQSRSEKYQDIDDGIKHGRLEKNKDLYKEVSNLELNEFDLNSNSSVIGDNDNIDIEEIKKIIDEKDPEKHKSICDTEEVELPQINLDETRSYDINEILKRAKESYSSSYEENKYRSMSNTEDILKDLTSKEDSNDGLVESNNDDPLDILSDLKGDDESTKVMGASKMDDESVNNDDEIEESEEVVIDESSDEENTDSNEKDKTNVIVKKIEDEEDSDEDDDEKDETEDDEDDDVDADPNAKFEQEDDEFADLKGEMGALKIIIRVLIVILIVILCVAGYFIYTKYFK